MLKKRNLLFLSLLILSVLILSSCFLNPPITEGIFKGQAMVPQGTILTKDLTGQALPDATVNIIDLTTGTIIATTTTDVSGHYQVSVLPGGPYLLEAVKGGVILEQITCQVEVGIEVDLGTVDCRTTAISLIALAMMDTGMDTSSINCVAISQDEHFNQVMIMVCNAIKKGEDPTVSSAIALAVQNFLNPPAPPAPISTYTVTFNSQGGSVVDSQTVNYGAKATEPTSPTRTGYTFSNWCKEEACTNAWDFASDTVKTDITLYAKWTAIPVSGITVSPTTLILVAGGDTGTITATVLPSDALNQNVTWESDDTAVATVVNGAVTSDTAGTATITATTEDGGFTATCSVTVSTPESYFTFDTGTKTIIDYDNVGGLDVVIPLTINGVAVEQIGVDAFWINSLTSVIIPDSVITIKTAAFAFNDLTSVTIGNSVTTIGEYAFNDNDLTSVTIGNSVTTIVHCAFRYNNLTSVTIGAGVTIGSDIDTMGSNSGFKTAYDTGGQLAGTYVYASGTWSKQ